ncbi:MAG: DUF262 domain-containing protein [Thermoanaerobaculaceae bacterium]
MEKLVELVRQFETGEIVLPIMQREYVWKPKKVEALLDSLYRKYPIGSFYLWRPSRKQPVRLGRQKLLAGEPVRYLLDGQQRLASLARAVTSEAQDTPLPPPGGGQRDAISWRAFFDVKTEVFVVKGRSARARKRLAAHDPSLVALSDLVSLRGFDVARVTGVTEEAVRRMVADGHITDNEAEKNTVRTRLARVARILDVDVLFQSIETGAPGSEGEDEVDQAITIFERLNRGGLTLSAADVAAARLSHEATEGILGPMRDFAREPACVALGINFGFLTRTLVTFRRGSAKVADLPRHWAAGPPPIEEDWNVVRRSLTAAIGVAQGAGWSARAWLPSINALIPVAYYAKLKGGSIPVADRAELVKYLCKAAWSGAFGGSAETAIDRYVHHLQKAGANCEASVLGAWVPKKHTPRITADDLLEETSKAGPLMQTYLAYLVSKQARSWPSGQAIGEASRLGDGRRAIEVHPIFPRQVFERLGLGLDANAMANYAILTDADNRQLADEAPRAAYERLSPDQKRWPRQQFIPVQEPEILEPSAYDAFTRRRAREMAEALNAFLGL